MNIRWLIIAVVSGLFFAVLVFGAPAMLTAEAAGSPGSLRPGYMAGDMGLAIPQAITAPTSVSLIPEKLGVVGYSYTFSATVSPSDTTQPISYTWEATGQAPIIHTGGFTDTVSFAWPISGTQVVTVTAANSWGTATDSETIFVPELLPLDTAVVFDVSGSMDFETNCFGCWNKDPAKSADIMHNPFPSNGNYNALKYDNSDVFWGGNSSPPGDFGTDFSKAGHSICSVAPTPITSGGFKYVVNEAELYSTNYPFNGWEFNQRTPGQGFWVIQRQNRGSNGTYLRPHSFVTYSQADLNNYPQVEGGSYNIECFSEGQCWKTRGLNIGESAPSNTPPYVEYDFTVDWDSEPQSNTNIWIRAIGGSSWSFEWYGQTAQQFLDWRKSIYWQVDGTPFGTDVRGGPFTNLRDMGNERDIVNDDDWRWVKIASNVDLANGPHTLRLYEGSAGFNLDKIIITNNPDGVVGTAVRNDGSIVGGGSLGITSVLSQNSGEGPPATPGSATREACNMCNPAFGQTVDSTQCTCKTGPTDFTSGNLDYVVGAGFGCTSILTPTNQLQNDLFHDIDPLRSAQEAAKNFAEQLDPRFDQIGILAYANDIAARIKLQCLRYEQNNGALGQNGCFDPTANHPLTTSGPISYTRVIQLVEDQLPSGTTNISQGMREGLEELGVSAGNNVNVQHGCTTTEDDKESCDRQGAAQRVLILITDGTPNDTIFCPSDYHWRGLIGANTNPFDCSMFFAKEAARNNVAVYTIGLGPGVPVELLTAMATGTDPNPAPGDDGFYFEPYCGQFFHAANLNDLDAIFDQILALARSCAQAALGSGVEPIYLPVIMKQ